MEWVAMYVLAGLGVTGVSIRWLGDEFFDDADGFTRGFVAVVSTMIWPVVAYCLVMDWLAPSKEGDRDR